MNWTKLSCFAEWKTHCKTVAEREGMRETDVKFGDGPAVYPALVVTYFVANRFISNYVLPADAAMLRHEPAADLLDSCDTPAAQSPRPKKEPAGPSRRENDIHVAAHLQALTYYLIETGICKKKPFEEKMQEFRDELRRTQ